MDRERDARGMNALRQELLQSGLTLGMNSSAPESRKKEESRPMDTIFSLGNSSMKSRLAEGRLGPFGIEKADAAQVEKSSRREAESLSGLDDRRSTNTTLQYDPRVDSLRAVSHLNLLSEGSSLSLQTSSSQNRTLFRQGSLLQRSSVHGGLPPNSHGSDGLQKTYSKDPSPKSQESPMASPKRSILEHGASAAPPQNPKIGQRRRNPNVRETKGLAPTASSHQPGLQRQSFHHQVLDARESKAGIPAGSSQQSVLQQHGLHQQIPSLTPQQQQQQAFQQHALRQQAFDARESKSMIPARSPQQHALQQQATLQQQALQQARHQQVLDPREGQGAMPPGSPQQHALQQQQQTLHLAAYQRVMDARESKGMISSGSPQHQSIQPQGRHHHVLDARDCKGMTSAGSPQQQATLQQQARHQQALDTRDSKGMTSSGSPQPAVLQQHSALEQQSRHQQALDSRESKGIISVGSPQHHSQHQLSGVHHQGLHQQVLDARDSKGIRSAVSPQQQSALQAVHQQDVRESATLPAGSPKQQALDGRESKGMIPSGSPQHQTLQQQGHHQQALDGREKKGMKRAGSPQHQALQHQQQQSLHQQVHDAREGKDVIPSGSPQQHTLQQHALHQHALRQQALEVRESKCMILPGSPKSQTPQQQGTHQQVFDAKESKGMPAAGSPKLQSLQQQALFHQVLDARESNGTMLAASHQQQAAQQQAIHQKVLDARESNGSLQLGNTQQQSIQQPAIQQVNQHAMQQQAIQQQTVPQQGRKQSDARESKGVVSSGSSQRQALQTFQQQALQQQALQQLQQVVSHQPLTQLSPQTLHLPNKYIGGFQSSQGPSTEQLSSSPHLGTLHLRGTYTASQPKAEPIELEGTASVDRSSVDRPSPAERRSPVDSTSPKDSVSVAETEEAVELGLKKMKTEESRPSLSLGSAAESKDSVRSGSRHDGDRESLHPQSHSSGRTSRENMFADLNAEPPPSDGDDEGLIPSDGVQMLAQPESSRTTTEEKRKRKKAIKDSKLVKEGDEVDNKRSLKPSKSRAKPKGELMVDSRLEGDGDNQLNSALATKEEKIKSLKAGLVHVARKLPRNAHAHFSLGLMHQRSGHYSKAAQAFGQAAEILKQLEEETGQSRGQFLATVQVHQAQCLLQESLGGRLGPGKELRSDEVESVVSKLKEATLLDAGQSSVWSTLGLLLLRSGRVQTAIHVLMSLLQVIPGHVDALANLGVAYLHSGELVQATRCFQSVLEKDKTHPGALINYAALLLRQYGSSFSGAGAGAGPGAYGPRVVAARAAQQCLEAALKEDPKAGYIWANLAAAYSTLGNIGRASQCLEQAAKLEPARMSTRYAVAAHRVKDAERSEDANDQLGWAANEMASIIREGDLTSIQPRLAWGGLAMVNRAQHETAAAFEGGGVDLKEVEERALHTLQQAIEEDPEDAVQWHQMGLHTLCTLQFGAAQSYFKTAISRRRTNPSAWSNLGIALQLSEDPSLAEGVYKQALALAPQEQAHSILSNLGNLYRQQRKFSEAHEVFKKALDLCPDYAPACNNLGLLLVAEGKWDDAIATFDRALHADPYLDAAKSNRMKAVALSQMRRDEAHEATPPTNLKSEVATGPSSPDRASPPVIVVTVSDASACSLAPVESTQREPFPLPSVS
ncbi:unnamed protein product [Calypogeia fissa]